MRALPDLQGQMRKAIALGPACVPQGLFAGPLDRVLLGLATHANTISHARLIALEETFPHTRAAMGEQAFNKLCREIIDLGGFSRRPLAELGRDLPHWMAGRNIPLELITLAEAELLWLDGGV
jgi:hypothetical protein